MVHKFSLIAACEWQREVRFLPDSCVVPQPATSVRPVEAQSHLALILNGCDVD